MNYSFALIYAGTFIPRVDGGSLIGLNKDTDFPILLLLLYAYEEKYLARITKIVIDEDLFALVFSTRE